MELLRLNDVIGHAWRWYISEAWEKLQPATVAGLVEDGYSRTSVLGIVSFHHNGYVRQQAVRLLAQIRDGSELPYLLIRQNDWVSPIGAEARDAVLVRLNPGYLAHFVANLPLVVHLLAFRRYDQATVVRRFVELAIQPQHDALLAQVIGSADRMTRRQIVSMALDLDGEHLPRVIHHALASGDGVVHYRAAKRIRSAFSGESLREILERLKQNRFIPVKREALLTECHLFPQTASAVWQQALLDDSPSIRDLARFHLARIGETEVALVYRQALANRPGLLAALSGLAETGGKSDLPLIRSYLTHPFPSRRRAAILGLARLGRETVIDELVECLRDDNPGVVREGVKQLGQFRQRVNAKRLSEIIAEDHRRHVRQTTLRLVFGLGKWQSQPWLIRASVHGDPETAMLARSFVDAWFTPPLCNKVFTKPSESERQAIGAALADCRGSVDEAFLKRLESWLSQT